MVKAGGDEPVEDFLLLLRANALVFEKEVKEGTLEEEGQ